MSQTLFIVILSVYAGSFLMIPLGILAWNMRVVYRPGYHRFLFTDENDVMHSVMRRLPPGTTRFDVTIGKQSHTYGIDNDCVKYSGRFRLPTYQYIIGCAEPLMIQPKKISLSSKVASIDFHNVAHNTAMSQLIAAMRKGIVNPVNIVIVMGVVVIITVVISGVYLGSELMTIKEAIGVR